MKTGNLRLLRPLRPSLFVFCAVLAGASAASADIVIDGDAAFTTSVTNCINSVNKVGGDPAQIITDLESSGKTCVVQKSSKSNNTTYTSTNDANSVAAGGTGKGSNGTVNWDPAYTDNYTEGIARDPCSSLIHELTHCQDGFAGTRDPRLSGGIKTNEIVACTIENKYRKAKGLPIRTQYGSDKLPASAIPADKDDASLDTTTNLGGIR
jgi:hypothetical protein